MVDPFALKLLYGKRAKTPPNQHITFSSKSLTRNGEIATAFAKQFSCPVLHSSDPSTQIVKRKLLKECPLDNSVFRFSPDIVSQAIKNSGNSLAVGPDDLTIHHLKHLVHLELQYLTYLYKVAVNHCNIPAIWKRAIITPFLKPGKPADLGTIWDVVNIPSPSSALLLRC